MKRSIFLLGLAAFAMTSCTQEENTAGGTGNVNAISFGTFVGKATKGTPVTGIDFPVDGDFLVIGYNTSSTLTAATAYPNFMRQTVTKTDASTYSYFPLRYWPSTGYVSFFAVFPAGVSTITPAAVSSAIATLPAVSYAVNTDPVKQADLMLASAVNKTSADGTASFSFTHALTKIGFTAKLAADYGANGTYIRITSISLKNVAGTGDFTAAEGGSWSQTTPTVFTSTFTLDYLKNLVDNGSVSTTTDKNMVLANSYLMMVPADYAASADAALEVKYTITYADGTTYDFTSNKLLKDLTVVAGKTWTSASAITYKMTITLNAVSFSATTTDWSANSDVAL
ncbi:MAG: fimbrillin family protein [Bacteroidales bacterium]|nr:fimbrillin family protein [Bacteroidales bacterium]MDD2756881.1 fimbrillin family protein [Methanothrix sp.]